MMPSLPGWLMMVESCLPEHWWPPAMLMQQLSAKFITDEYPPAGLMRRKFIVPNPPNMGTGTESPLIWVSNLPLIWV